MMRNLRRCRVALYPLLLALAVPSMAAAQEQSDDPLDLKIGGVYTAWFQNQHDFFFGRTDYNDRYAVQMLRLNLSLGYGDYIEAVTRFDMAQGWWGVDNDDYRGDFEPNPSLSSRFSNKDTNYALHVDLAYLEFLFPGTPVRAQVGRTFYGLGNKLVLDSNFDGIQLKAALGVGTLGLGWAKVYEGAEALTDNDLSESGGIDGEDADLFMATFDSKALDGALSWGLFGMYYVDRGDDDLTTFMPQNIDYFRPRFTPNVSSVAALGVTANYTNEDLGFDLQGEFDYLTGSDDVDNESSLSNQLLDVNNGDLSGYNVYAKATKSLGPRTDLGLVFGRGSGDEDLGSGEGNINKLKTMGFFYITEVWEESIMPDEAGITPQGLGAPNTRGYRELENTTILQGSLAFRPAPRWRTFASYSWIRATESIHGWADADADGAISPAEFTDESSQDIGSEVDFLIAYKPYTRLDLALKGGYLMAGEGAQLLINGNTEHDANPWELKAMVTYTF
jgi:hypothetical protein